MKNLILKFHRDQDAATAVEYAIMLALIAVACMQFILLNGNEILQWWSNIDSDMGSAINR